MLKKLSLYTLILGCITLFTDVNSANFQNPTDKNFSYIFVPGIFSIDTQTAKYIPEFIGSSAETVLCSAGIHTLNQPISTCTFSEISTQSLTDQSFNPFVYIGYLITNWQNKKYGVSVKKNQPQQPEQDLSAHQLFQPTSPSAYTVEKHAFDFTKLNLAQEADINSLLKTYNEHIQKYPETDVILYGVSRGAATICTFMGKHQPQNVKALILEAPFDSLPHLLKHRHQTTHRFINKLLPKIISYDPNGDSPIMSIENISKEIPILIITSKSDDVVPTPCAKALMRKFNKLGYDKVHLLILDKSSHSGYAFDDYSDKTKYESVVHAFYKHYGRPYDESLASFGSEEWKKISGQATLMPTIK